VPKLKLRQMQELDTWRRSRFGPETNRALGAAAAYRGDVLLVESEHDAVIPHEVIHNYRGAFAHSRSLTYRTIAGADHGLRDPACRQAYTTLLVNWITEMIAGDRLDEPAAQKRLQEAMKTQQAAKAG
jgi:dienelactone hydrolase